MAAKITLVIVATLAFAHAHVVPAPVGLAPVPVFTKVDDYDPHPHYTYAYDVQDAITGDSKAQYETRNGDVVQGSYSLIEADGTRRVVEYTADPINGFNAVVHREPAIIKAALPPVAPVIPAPVPAVFPAPVPAPGHAVFPPPVHAAVGPAVNVHHPHYLHH